MPSKAARATSISRRASRPCSAHDGELDPATEFPPLNDADLRVVLETVTAATPRRRQHFDETGDLDIAYSEEGLPRFRVNGFRQRGATSFAFRLIPDTIAGFPELHLPPGVASSPPSSAVSSS